MVTYDIFVHPGFPAEEKAVRNSPHFREYCDRLSSLAASAEHALHIVDPKVGNHDSFLDGIIADDRKVRSYVLNIPFFPSSYGTVCREDWDTFVGLLRHAKKHYDPVRIHGAYHGICVLDFAVQLYELLHNGKQYLPNTMSSLLEAPFPFGMDDTEEVVLHALHAHYSNSNIRFGTVFAPRDFDQLPRIRKSMVRQMSDRETKVYSF